MYRSDHPKADSRGRIHEHILIAEKALGKPLPKGAEIHHYGERADNTKLVICQDQAYHKLLHRRMRAIKACGHASWRKCQYCKQYDKPENLHVKGCHVYHNVCRATYMKEYHKKNKAKIAVKDKERYQKGKIERKNI